MTTQAFGADAFTPSSFWQKLTKYAVKAGREVVQKALEIYYVTTDDKTPAKIKALGAAALGYFIFPIDVIPDPVPFVGYTDDLTVLAAAAVFLAPYITEDIRKKAAATLSGWFN
ncbi:MAG: YkvA family protein [Pseudomonas sp.]|nr:YkvA family protein [Pseudomonas sp.]